MNTIPFFPATDVTALIFRPRNTLPPSLLRSVGDHDFLSAPLRSLASTGRISSSLLHILGDISLGTNVGADAIFKAQWPPSLEHLLETRDRLIHRLLSMAPDGVETEDEHSDDECVRLAALVFHHGSALRSRSTSGILSNHTSCG